MSSHSNPETEPSRLLPLPREFFDRPVVETARTLLGMHLVRTDSDGRPLLVGRVVETEAYHQTDPASHSFRGKTRRTEVMFGPPGHAYVYLIYGMHFCFNVVCEKEDTGSAVLVRAVEPVMGLELMAARRPAARARPDMTNGPAKLAQAFAITRDRDNGKDLSGSDLLVCEEARTRGQTAQFEIATSTRIGISTATDRKWRFYVADNAYVSKARASRGGRESG